MRAALPRHEWLWPSTIHGHGLVHFCDLKKGIASTRTRVHHSLIYNFLGQRKEYVHHFMVFSVTYFLILRKALTISYTSRFLTNKRSIETVIWTL